MKHSVKLLFALLLMATGCSDLATRCIMKEAVIAYQNSPPMFKRTFTHDGSHYVQFKDYYYDELAKDFHSDPDWINTITYTNDRVSHVVKNYGGGSSYSITQDMTYTTVKSVTTVSTHEVVLSGGAVASDRTFDRYIIETLHDTTYLSKNEMDQLMLIQFEHGNLRRIGFQSPTGKYSAYDTTWTFSLVYNYDNLPNLTSDYVFQDLVSYSPNERHCTNNLIETIINPDSDNISIRQTYNRTIDKQLAKYTYEATSRYFTISYDCK